MPSKIKPSAVTSTNAVRKSRRFKSTTSTERNIRKFQKESDFRHIVKAAPFERLCRDVLAEFQCDLRMSAEFQYAFRELIESWHQGVMVDSRRICQNAGRRVLQDKHIQQGAYDNLKGNPLLQQCFTRYLEYREMLGLDPRIKITTAEGEANWMQRRQMILEHNRAVSDAREGSSKKRKASDKSPAAAARSSAKKSKVEKAAESEENTDADDEEEEEEEQTTTGADSGLSKDMETEAVVVAAAGDA